MQLFKKTGKLLLPLIVFSMILFYFPAVRVNADPHVYVITYEGGVYKVDGGTDYSAAKISIDNNKVELTASGAESYQYYIGENVVVNLASAGTITENHGTIAHLTCNVVSNFGNISYIDPAGGVSENKSGGIINISDGSVGTNCLGASFATCRGSLTTNNGTVYSVSSYGIVATNNGTVVANCNIVNTNNGTVNTNNGTVTTNNGTVVINNINVFENNGTINTNNGTATTNDGTVRVNAIGGTVTENNGSVLKNEDGASVTNTALGRVYEVANLSNVNNDAGGFVTQDPAPVISVESTLTKTPEAIFTESLDETQNKISEIAKSLLSGEVKGEQTVFFEGGDSLPLDIMKSLKGANGVTLDFKCEYDNKKYHFVIKGGDLMKLDESIPWYGPLYLSSVYGIVPEE